MKNEPPPPLLSDTDLCLIKQGLQKIIQECADQTSILFLGSEYMSYQEVHEKDENLKKIDDLFQERKRQCEQLIVKIPLIGNLQNVMAAFLNKETHQPA